MLIIGARICVPTVICCSYFMQCLCSRAVPVIGLFAIFSARW